jgi:endonuclease III
MAPTRTRLEGARTANHACCRVEGRTPMTDKLTTALLDRYGRTYAEEAGIRLADKPAPLYQLVVLATLLSARISAGVAVAAGRELFQAGYRTPRAMLEASWQDRVDALGRGHYRRYDERTSSMLGDGARLCIERWRGDLRRLHMEADGDVDRLRDLLMEFPGIGPTGAEIFLREVQDVWPDVRPFMDRKVLDGAKKLRLPSSADGLAQLVAAADVSRLASALVRVSLDRKAAEVLKELVPR